MTTATEPEKRKKTVPSGQELLLTAVGDVFLPGTVRLPDGRMVESDEQLGKTVFDRVLSYFHNSDVNFCNLEVALSSKGNLKPGRPSGLRSYPSMVEVLKRGRIDFVSLANNHIMDYGLDAMFETMEILGQNGIGYSGAGKNIEKARKPASVKKKGLTVGLLSYTTNTNLPMGFQAAREKPGLAPVRISPFFSPGHTNKEDLEALQKDIRKWQDRVDFLIVSFHWGVSDGGTHTVALHQQVIAHHAIDAGADLILGHHPHAIQGVEIYRNKPICYSLGHFLFPFFTKEEGFPRETMLFQCRISPDRVHEAKFFPSFLSEEGQPEIISPEEGKGAEIVSLMKKLCSEFGTTLAIRRQTGGVIFKGKKAAKE
jgi:poly-gamma-glutamate capsule biosynthesis protein CapA/YwtB (metallophosphatase superfamily)